MLFPLPTAQLADAPSFDLAAAAEAAAVRLPTEEEERLIQRVMHNFQETTSDVEVERLKPTQKLQILEALTFVVNTVGGNIIATPTHANCWPPSP